MRNMISMKNLILLGDFKDQKMHLSFLHTEKEKIRKDRLPKEVEKLRVKLVKVFETQGFIADETVNGETSLSYRGLRVSFFEDLSDYSLNIKIGNNIDEKIFVEYYTSSESQILDASEIEDDLLKEEILKVEAEVIKLSEFVNSVESFHITYRFREKRYESLKDLINNFFQVE